MWTEERIDALRKMWTEGRTASEIAKALGHVTRSAVCGKAHRLKLETRTVAQRAPKGSRQNYNHKSFDQISRTRVRHGLSHITDLERRILGEPVKKGLGPLFKREVPTEPLPPIDTMPAKVSANDLEMHHCRAIVAEHLPFDGDRKIYCGERREPGKSYCTCHVRRYENTIPATAATRAVVQGVYRAPGKNFGVGHTARVNEFLTETT